MKISDIKQSAEILQTAQHLGIVINAKTKRAVCPFHADKTPSLQFSEEKQICTCFSSNCDAGTMDVIKLTEKKLNLTTHEALKYLKSLAPAEIKSTLIEMETTNYHTDAPLSYVEVPALSYVEVFETMQSSFVASSVARKYAEERNLNWKDLQIGYNAFKNSKFNYLRGCITFRLRDENGKVVSLYGRSVRDNDSARHYYTKNRTGLYPNYPGAATKTIILTESIIDCATLESIPELNKTYSFVALYGTNGLTAEHTKAIQQLAELQEVILFFDGDQAGKQANEKQGKFLSELLPGVKISIVNTPQDEDINSLMQGHNPKIFNQLLKERTLFSFQQKEEKTAIEQSEITAVEPAETKEHSKQEKQLSTKNPNNITYITTNAHYQIKGGIRKDLDSLKVTLVIEELNTKKKSRTKLDLYEDKQTEKVARESAEKLNLRADLLLIDLQNLTDLLDEYRESVASKTETTEAEKITLTPTEKEECIAFLKRPNLIQNINDLIGESGVVGEENNRIFLFGIASSYKMENTLHALIQGSSGSGKTHLLASVMDFMPNEDTISLTRVTESSFYNYGEYELQNKLIGMEDFDGLEEKAELAFRELQSKGAVSSSTSGKNEHTGEITGYVKYVYGPIASLSATTKGEIYEDNMSRCFLVSVDESAEQTAKIIAYQNNKSAGLINSKKEKEITHFLQNTMRLVQPLDVVNPYANKINLPKEAHKIRRLNDLFQSYVKQITLLNQYQRQKDQQNRIITQKEDVQTAVEIMFESIVLKVDELDGSLREFYEKLKKYIETKGKDYEFIQREIRHEFRISKTQLFRNINQLELLEYIQKRGTGMNGATTYKIIYWDDNAKMRAKIKEDLKNQIKELVEIKEIEKI